MIPILEQKMPFVQVQVCPIIHKASSAQFTQKQKCCSTSDCILCSLKFDFSFLFKIKITNMLNNVLFHFWRFGLNFTEHVIAGLHPKTNEPFICNRAGNK